MKSSPDHSLKSILLILSIISTTSQCLLAQDAVELIRRQFFTSWEIKELLPGGRFDAIVNLGNGVFIVGSRGREHPGLVFRTEDYGETWSKIVSGIDDEITCLANGEKGICYLLTGKSLFYISKDYGLTWSYVSKVSENNRFQSYKLSYGIGVTEAGTLLISDTNPDGGHIFRSIDGGANWTDLGPVSSHGLYRFEKVYEEMIVNGWEGAVYKSVDDGQTWQKTAELEEGALYATEHLGDGQLFQATEAGNIYLSLNAGVQWTKVGSVREAADDFVTLGAGRVLLSTYTDEKKLYVSNDLGKSWVSIGPPNAGVPGDWLDHVIPFNRHGESWIMGCTNKGFVIVAKVAES